MISIGLSICSRYPFTKFVPNDDGFGGTPGVVRYVGSSSRLLLCLVANSRIALCVRLRRPAVLGGSCNLLQLHWLSRQRGPQHDHAAHHLQQRPAALLPRALPQQLEESAFLSVCSLDNVLPSLIQNLLSGIVIVIIIVVNES